MNIDRMQGNANTDMPRHDWQHVCVHAGHEDCIMGKGAHMV